MSSSTGIGKNPLVKLNIGGTIFTTNLQTLTSVKDTFFTGFFKHSKPEDDGSFFIDRPSDQFHLILNYLRGIDVEQKLWKLNDSELKDFIDDVVYYEIAPIYEILPRKGLVLLKSKYGIASSNYEDPNTFDSTHCSSNLTVFGNGKRVKKTGEFGWDACVLGGKCTKFSMKVNTPQNHIMIGFAPRTVKLNGLNHDSCGYFVCAENGALFSACHKDAPYACKFKSGSIVECKLENGNISFSVDGEDMGIAYSNVPSTPKLYPAFEVIHKGCELEFV